ncbi:NAD(P)H-dependent oxidoreductase [Solirubrobacter taibaiensis]|nr:NAD(P)H-dependent oxidoreductase [Solirubrobacter taibaiensis]
MSIAVEPAGGPIRAARPEDIGATTVLGVSPSLKPAPTSGGRSAAFSLLSFALKALEGARVDVALLNLRDVPLPFFDGRLPTQRDDEGLQVALRCVERAGGLFIAVPAYWSGVSGVFKNFIDTLCGPAYDLPDPVTTVFTGKPVALLVVGADEASAEAGAREAPRIVESAGARVVSVPVSVANPRRGFADAPELSRRLILLGGELAYAVHGEQP